MKSVLLLNVNIVKIETPHPHVPTNYKIVEANAGLKNNEWPTLL